MTLLITTHRLRAACAVAWLACAGSAAWAQHAPSPLQFSTYLEAVESGSLDLQAQRESITAAQAGVGIAGLRPDPQLSLELSREQVRNGVPRPVSRNPSISWMLETGGKRDARIRAARSNVKLVEADVQGFLHDLFNTTAGAYTEACRTQQVLQRKQQTLQSLNDVVRANQIRRNAGDVGGVELLQSRVERDQFQSEVTLARADAQAALLALSVPLGQPMAVRFGNAALDCEFRPFEPGAEPDALVAQALRVRDDIRIAEATLDNARDKASLAHANRWVDPTVSLGVTNTPGHGAGLDSAGAPFDSASRSRMLAVSVSVPLPLSRLDRGDLVQAESQVTQAMLGLQQMHHKVEADVRAAHFRFVAAQDNVTRYRSSMLADAQQVLDGMRLSYRNGAASLLELLSAQRSADGAYLDFLQAQADLATATVQLQLSVGLHPAL